MSIQQRQWQSVHPFIPRFLKKIFHVPGILCLAFICSCTQYPAAQQRTAYFTENQWHKPTATADPIVHIDFVDACQMAAIQNKLFLQLLMQQDLSILDIKQAESEVWPRLELQANGQIPFGGKNNFDSIHARGGLYIRYNFHKALFRADAAATARAIQNKQLEKIKGLIIDLSYRLFDLLNEASILEKEVQLRQTMASRVHQGLQTAHKLSELRIEDHSVVWHWESLRHLHQQHLQKARYILSKTKQTIKYMLGLSNSQQIVIKDIDHICSKLEKPFNITTDNLQFMTAILNKHPESRAAAYDLFLAEMAIVQAKRQRLPRLTGSIGLGRFDVLSDNDEESPATLELAIAMPFLDWGDIRRNVNKAERRKAWAQRRIQLLTHQLHHDIVEAQNEWHHAKNACQQTKKIWQTMRAQVEKNHQLLNMKLIQPLDANKFQLESYNAEIEYHHSLLTLYKSESALKKRLGLPIVENLPQIVIRELQEVTN